MVATSQKIENEFPINFLYRALHILETKGNSDFRHYVNRINMPSIDIERVLSKYAYRHNPEYRGKINALIKEFERKVKTGFQLKDFNMEDALGNIK